MPAGSTYSTIATYTVTSAQASYTFSSIPSTYTDLVLVGNAIGTADLNFLLRFNGITSSEYSSTLIAADGSTRTSFRFSNQTSLRGNYFGYVTTSLAANTIIQIMNYSNTTTNKTTLHRFNNGNTGVDSSVGLWRNTAAINSITILNDNATTFATGTTFNLYGIAAA
jgi:hypothetical protein